MSRSLKGEQIPSPNKATDSVGFLLQGFLMWLSGEAFAYPMQETWVRSLIQEDPTCLGRTKSMHDKY
ncbi:hypothetical protein R6Z07F_015601 [Ovis aries]